MRFDLKQRINYLISILAIIIGLFLDQLTKHLAAKYLFPGKTILIIPHILNLSIVRNQGAAFGIGSKWGPFWQNFFFLGLSSLAIVLIGYFLIKNIRDSKLFVVSISMILSGAIGNVYDRIRFGYVVDFIELHYKQYHWPNFNFADTVICIGVGLYLIHTWTISKKEKVKKSS